jgi:hypothetical protein
MPDQLTAPDRPGSQPDDQPRERSAARAAVLQLVLTLVVFAALGALAGVVWFWVWTPPVGLVVDHRWVAGNEAALTAQFSGTGWFVVVATIAGLLGGVLVALLLDRLPLLTLLAVILGSALATWVMLHVGAALGPADPVRLAQTAKEGIHLPGRLEVSRRSPWIALPAGALIGLTLVFLGLSARAHVARDTAQERDEPEPAR